MMNEATNREKEDCSLQNDNCRNEFFNTRIKSINECPRYKECLTKKVETRKNQKRKEDFDRLVAVKKQDLAHANELYNYEKERQEEERKPNDSWLSNITSLPSNTIYGTKTVLNNTGHVLGNIGSTTNSVADSLYTNIGFANLFGKTQTQKDNEIKLALQKLDNIKQECSFSRKVNDCKEQRKPEIVNKCKELIVLGNVPDICKYVRPTGGKKTRKNKKTKMLKRKNSKTKKQRKTKKFRKTKK